MRNFILSWLFVYILLETLIREKTEFLVMKNSTDSENSLVLKTVKGKYNCHYAQLACGCYSKYGGCGVTCSPTYSYTLYNQTSCPKLQNYFLAGFD